MIYIGAKDFGPDRHRYLIRMHSKENLVFVDSEAARKKCPQLVIEYFEKGRPWSYMNSHPIYEAERKMRQERINRQNEEHDRTESLTKELERLNNNNKK